MGQIIERRDDLTKALEKVRESGKKIVFTNGCFDLLHPGHTRSLIAARDLGDCLVVGLNSDNSVRNLKGIRRPILPLEARAELLAALYSVDFVVPFEEDTPLQLIEVVKPDILVKGTDYKVEDIVGADFVKENGGEVKQIPLVEGWSTTKLVEETVHKYTHPTDSEPTPPYGSKLS